MKHHRNHPLAAILLTLITQFLAETTLAAPPLSSQTMDNWMASQKALKTWGDQHHKTLAKYEDQIGNDNPLDITPEAMLQPLKSVGLYDSAEQLVRQYGFANLHDWAALSLRITKAAAALQFSRQPQPDLSELEALQQSSKASPQQQQIISDTIAQNKAIALYLRTQVSKEDQQFVAPYLEHINRLLNSEP